MPDDLEIRVDTKRLRRAMESVPGELFSALRTAFRDHHIKFLNKFKRENLRSSKSGRGVQSRSRQLSRSFDTAITGRDLDSLEVETFSAGVPYARIHEYGGEIRAKSGKFLTIPLKAARTQDREGAITRASARHFEDTFFHKSRAGNLLLMQRRGDEIVPLFLLKQSVKLEARLGFRDLWERMEPDFVKRVNKAVDRVLEPGEAA